MNPGVPLASTAAQLMAKAREVTGIDRHDEEIGTPLEILVAAFNGESRLTARGAIEMERKLLRLLCNRLRLERDFERHPEIDEQVITTPVLLCGLPRTGTTKLQHVLAVTGDFNWLPLWQACNPALITGDRNESPQPRINDADAFWTWFNEASPEARRGHSFEALEPDEDTHIMEHCFVSSPFFAYSEVPSYMQWLTLQDPMLQFLYLRRTLKYLQWQGLQREGRPWVLKCPLNVSMQPQLREVFPDSALVMTHRDPKELVASSSSLMDSFHKPFTNHNGNHAALAEGFALQLDAHLANRTAHPELNLLDVHYRCVVHDIEATVAKIYQRIGIQFNSATSKCLRAWEAQHVQHRHGAHRYSLADYGFDEVALDSRFSGYLHLMRSLFASA
ncbi:MAG: sulfotransferase [Steroidobacteraceae bacterium]